MNEAAKITLWFDKFSSIEEHLDILKKSLELNCDINIIGIKYNTEVGKLILNNFEQISDFNFENLNKDSVVFYNNKKYKLPNTSLRIKFKEITLINEKGEREYVKLGDFKLEEEMQKVFENF